MSRPESDSRTDTDDSPPVAQSREPNGERDTDAELEVVKEHQELSEEPPD